MILLNFKIYNSRLEFKKSNKFISYFCKNQAYDKPIPKLLNGVE